MAGAPAEVAGTLGRWAASMKPTNPATAAGGDEGWEWVALGLFETREPAKPWDLDEPMKGMGLVVMVVTISPFHILCAMSGLGSTYH